MKHNKITKKLIASFRYGVATLLLSGFLGLEACKDNEPLTGNAYVNTWIYDHMNFWYYWNNQIPTKISKNQEPETFFNSLLSNDDRFSSIHDDYTSILKALEGVSKEAGYEFTLFRESEANSNVIAQVLFIKPGSPASSSALKRGDVITHFNGQQITLDNYRNLLNQITENHTLTYRPITVTSSSSGSFGSPVSLSLNTVEYQENPNFYTGTYDEGQKKAGYYIYNFFASGIDTGKEYNNQMDQIMTDFAAQGITDLIVDLRYNGGGYVEASLNLASVIGKNIDNTKTFSKRQFNTTVSDYFKLTDADVIDKFVSKAQNIGNSLSGNLYILTGPRTASASELIINGLRPFMNVILIGEVTVGKNVGSIPVYEENDPKNKWIMLPIVMKSFNSNNQSEYGNGFIPEVFVDEGTYLLPLGDREEPLLSAALAHIAASPGRLAVPKTKHVFGRRIGTSLDFRNNGVRNLMLEKPIKVSLQNP